MLQLANHSVFPWETWEFIFNLKTQLPKAFKSIKQKSMRRRVRYKYFLHFGAFLCYHLLQPLTVTQYFLYCVYFHHSTLNSSKSYFRILCAKINLWHLHSYYERTCMYLQTSNTYKVFAENILVKMMTLRGEKDAIPLSSFWIHKSNSRPISTVISISVSLSIPIDMYTHTSWVQTNQLPS